VWSSGAEPVVVLNKIDLDPHLEPMIEAIERVAIGVPLVRVSDHVRCKPKVPRHVVPMQPYFHHLLILLQLLCVNFFSCCEFPTFLPEASGLLFGGDTRNFQRCPLYSI
jgi:hypothetical protein